MSTYAFKKIGLFSPDPKCINCLKYNEKLEKIALSRSDNSLEIWDVKHIPHIDRIFYRTKDQTIEDIVWCGDRIITCGLNGYVVEHDFQSLSIKFSIPVTSGPCWCVDINAENTLIAAGTEDGYINIIRVYEEILEHEQLLDKQEGRILCVAWHDSGDYLASGSEDAVRVWNVKTGHAIHKLTPERLEAAKPTTVWCLAVTTDFVIISGDSRGKITFWDGFQGICIDSHQSHKADVLAICIDKSQSKLYCAGVDPLIASFEKIQVRGTNSKSGDAIYKWVKSIQRVLHTHDVRALTMCREKLFSGGVDGYLACSSYPPKILIKYLPSMQSSRMCLASEAGILMIMYDFRLEFWELSQTGRISNIAMIKSYKDQQIRCAAISADGVWISYATDDTFRLFILQEQSSRRMVSIKGSGMRTPMEKTYSIKRMHNMADELAMLKSKPGSGAVRICFSADSKWLVVADKKCSIIVAQLNPDEGAHIAQILPDEKQVLTDVIHLLLVTQNCEFIVAADRSSNIAVWKQSMFHCSLPKHDSSPTAIAVNNTNDCLVVAYADHRIVEFDLKKKKYTSFSRALSEKHPKQWLNRQYPVEGILFNPKNNNVIIIYDDTAIWIIDKAKKLPDVSCKIPRLAPVKSPEHSDNSDGSNSQFSVNDDNIALHVLKEYKHLVYLTTFAESELLVVELSPDDLAEKLPPHLSKRRFGVM